VSPLKIIISGKNIHEKPTTTTIINSVFNYVSALLCHLQGVFLVSSERYSIEKQSIEYCG
jgi:hypothetical protein